MTGLGTQVHSRIVFVDSQPWLRGDTTVEIWNNSVYDWVERPWSAASWCHIYKDKCSLLWYHLHVYECIFVVYLIIV